VLITVPLGARLRSAAEKMKNEDCGRFGRLGSCGVTHGPLPSLSVPEALPLASLSSPLLLLSPLLLSLLLS